LTQPVSEVNTARCQIGWARSAVLDQSFAPGVGGCTFIPPVGTIEARNLKAEAVLHSAIKDVDPAAATGTTTEATTGFDVSTCIEANRTDADQDRILTPADDADPRMPTCGKRVVKQLGTESSWPAAEVVIEIALNQG
jgi:hypothetical protein